VLNIGRSSLYPDWADALGIAQVGTLNMSELRWFASFYKTYVGKEWRFLALGRNRNYQPLFTDTTLDLLGVRFVIVDKNQKGSLKHLAELGYPVVQEDGVRLVFENPGYMDRAYIAGTLVADAGIPVEPGVAATTDDELLKIASQLGISDRTEPAGTATVAEYRNGTVKLAAELGHPGILVVSDAWHPGWTATVDGKPVYIGRVNVAFRGIALPAGSHKITMSYTPPFFAGALLLSGAGALGLLGIALVLRQRRRTLDPRQAPVKMVARNTIPSPASS
jgi:hypothetical protein